MAVFVLLISACSDNDSFSANRNSRLSFSQDTIHLDTLFSGVPSVTHTFWVHNHSGDGLRISSVRLEKGSQAGFRVNVDGTFLNPVAQDLEVRKDDSLRVFVEVTTYENHQDEPQLVEDNLLFTLESGVEQKVNLRTYSWDAQQVKDLTIASDTTIETMKPLVVYGDGITVAEGATLTLRNTTLYFHDEAWLKVKGKLVAEGCTLRGDRLDHMFDYLPYDRVSGQWRGIEIQKESQGCWLTDTEVRNAWNGMTADSTKVVLTNTVLHNHRGYGLYARNSDVELDYCQLSNTENDCLSLHGCTAKVSHTTLAQFYPLTADRGAALAFAPADKPLVLECSHTLVTGYNDDVVMGQERDGEMVIYQFDNCLLRTPEVDDQEAFTNIIWEQKSDDDDEETVKGKNHFVTIDEENLIYDFTISTKSPAHALQIGRAFATVEDEEQTNE